MKNWGGGGGGLEASNHKNDNNANMITYNNGPSNGPTIPTTIKRCPGEFFITCIK